MEELFTIEELLITGAALDSDAMTPTDKLLATDETARLDDKGELTATALDKGAELATAWLDGAGKDETAADDAGTGAPLQALNRIVAAIGSAVLSKKKPFCGIFMAICLV
jgi:hypothetical protein